MTMKFYGTVDEIKNIIQQSGYLGGWLGDAASKLVFKANIGAILNWWVSTGTVTVQGKQNAVAEFKEVIAPLLLKIK